jgi:hypothetical protein
MFFLVFSVAIDLSRVHMQYRSDSAYITRRKRVIRGSNCRFVLFLYGFDHLKRFKMFCCFVCFIKRAILRFA